MNKAFTRDPDPVESARCPRCQSIGLPVTRETLESFVLPEALGTVAESAFFCPYPTCEIVYFDVFDRALGTERVKKQVYPKDPNAPICGCFGLTLDDIEQDVNEGVVTRCKELINKAKSPAARCAIMSPNGQSCIAEVQRQYMKRRQQQNDAM
jgi:hypothetical protein